MANGNFVVQNGLTVGPLTIDAASGNVVTTGVLTTTNSTYPAAFIDVTATGNISSSSTAYTKISSGTSAQRPSSASLGMIRYNSDISSYEGYGAGSAWSSLGGVKSVDGKAYISAEASAGAGDDVLRFYSGSTGSSTQVMWASGSNVTIPMSTTSTSSTTGALVVTGGVGIGGDVWVGGTLTVANLQARGTSQITVQDPMLYLQANVLYPWSYDTGIYSDSIGGAANTYVHHGMIRNNSTSEWTFFSNVKSEPGSTINWADAGLVYDTVKTGHILPGANLTYNLGSSTAWWGTMYGLSTQAKYADLAENYQGDKFYNPGTVVMFGGTAEVTLATADTQAVAGVVSTNPAHLMNGQLTGSTVVALALTGRVPCNVIGPVKKGDMMVSAGFGYAKASASPLIGQVIGKAIEDFPVQGKGVIEVVVGRL
jgi:hypothetical protein